MTEPLRGGWARRRALLSLDRADLTALVRPAFPDAEVVAARHAEGGLANTNYRLRLSDRAEPVLLRLHVRDGRAMAREAALHRLLAGRVPVAEVLHAAPGNPVTGHPYMLQRWVEGERLDRFAARATADELAEAGRSVGAALAAIGAVTFETTGFFDERLRVAEPADVGSAGFRRYVGDCLSGRAGPHLGAGLAGKVLDFVERRAVLLDAMTGPACLTHADFGGSNILVRKAASGWAVAAVLDWEFAFAGNALFDIGNLLRPPLGRSAAFERAFIAGYREHGGVLPDDWRRLSLLVDLLAWADLLNRPDPGGKLVGDAVARIEGIMKAVDGREFLL